MSFLLYLYIHPFLKDMGPCHGICGLDSIQFWDELGLVRMRILTLNKINTDSGAAPSSCLLRLVI